MDDPEELLWPKPVSDPGTTLTGQLGQQPEHRSAEDVMELLYRPLKLFVMVLLHYLEMRKGEERQKGSYPGTTFPVRSCLISALLFRVQGNLSQSKPPTE